MAQQKQPTLVTPKGTAVYPWVSKPDTKFNPAGDFRTGLRMPLEVAQPLIDKLEAVRQEALAESKKAKKKPPKEAPVPWSPAYDDEGNETGEIEFKFKTKASFTTKDGKTVTRTIKVFDAAKQPLEDVSIYGGSEIKVAFQPNVYDTAIGVGINLRMTAVQVIKLVSGGGDGGASAFDVEDGYTAPKKSAEAEDEDADESDF